MNKPAAATNSKMNISMISKSRPRRTWETYQFPRPAPAACKRLSMTFLELPRSKYNQYCLQKSFRTRAERSEGISDHGNSWSKSSKSLASSRCMLSEFSTWGRTCRGCRAIPRRKHSRQKNYLNTCTCIRSRTLHSSRGDIDGSKHELTTRASNSKRGLRRTGPFEGINSFLKTSCSH